MNTVTVMMPAIAGAFSSIMTVTAASVTAPPKTSSLPVNRCVSFQQVSLFSVHGSRIPIVRFGCARGI